MSASSRERSGRANMPALWHDIECGAYEGDLELWRELSAAADGPILEFGRHDPYGIGWLLWYLPPGGGADAELTFLADHGEVPIERARAHLRRVLRRYL